MHAPRDTAPGEKWSSFTYLSFMITKLMKFMFAYRYFRVKWIINKKLKETP